MNPQFGRLTIIAEEGTDKWRRRLVKCLCDCGKDTIVRFYSLKSGNTRSCGCLFKEINFGITAITHGATKDRKVTRAYQAWKAMKVRCQNTKSKYFKNYGGRGITICERWQSFTNFLADMGECPAGLSLERSNNNGNYEPGNCKWTTMEEQNRNRRSNVFITFEGRTQCMSDWANEFHLRPGALRYRLSRGWPVYRAFNEPLKKSKPRRKFDTVLPSRIIESRSYT
jgi:hypothetical protein